MSTLIGEGEPNSLKLWMMLGSSLHLWFLKTRDYIKLGSNYYIKLGSNYYIKHSMQTWFKLLHQTWFEIFYINTLDNLREQNLD